MNHQERAELALRDLEPLLAARGVIHPPSGKRYKWGGRSAPATGWVRVRGGLEVTLTRSLSLSPWEAGLLDPYGRALDDLTDVPDTVARTAAEEVALRAIAVQLGGSSATIVESAVRFLYRCAADTYEGQPVHLNLLLDLSGKGVEDARLDLDEFEQADWHALLGSGLDTGILIDRLGNVLRVEDVRQGSTADSQSARLHADALRHIAAWSADHDGIGLSLSRSREIVVHQGGRLRYIHRSGKWRALPLDLAVDSGWSTGSSFDKALKREILASAIDVSLGHHGGCLAVIPKGRKLGFNSSGIVQDGDMWPENVRASLFASSRFQDLTRRQRLEILSMDGATVLDRTGQIIAAGAIVGVEAGSTGGGRLAATKSLARYGAALKISQDGPISLFGRDHTGEVTQLLSLA